MSGSRDSGRWPAPEIRTEAAHAAAGGGRGAGAPVQMMEGA
jgi:hypothetical protein